MRQAQATHTQGTRSVIKQPCTTPSDKATRQHARETAVTTKTATWSAATYRRPSRHRLVASARLRVLLLHLLRDLHLLHDLVRCHLALGQRVNQRLVFENVALRSRKQREDLVLDRLERRLVRGVLQDQLLAVSLQVRLLGSHDDAKHLRATTAQQRHEDGHTIVRNVHTRAHSHPHTRVHTPIGVISHTHTHVYIHRSGSSLTHKSTHRHRSAPGPRDPPPSP